MKIAICVIIIAAVAAIGFASGAEWSASRGKGLGKDYMKEFGLEDEKKQDK